MVEHRCILEKASMRTDYILYIVAVLLFVITGIVAVYPGEFQQLWIVGATVLGFFFAGLGFSQRPRTKATQAVTPPPLSEPVQTAVAEPVRVEEPPAVVETVSTTIDLTQVKGVKAKRAEQLKALGINSVQDLANASAEDLAKKLQISPRFTEKWIASAKELVEKS
jgi:predicted flap endonuclease-1-like 5' DNA nuclease